MKIEKRRTKLILNSSTSMVYQFATIICGFILPRLFLQYYGSEVNGLISSITQFLSFVAMMELGIGSVVQSSLYKPLSVMDEKKVSQIIRSAQNIFNKIAAAFMVYLLILVIFYPRINDTFPWAYTASLIVILAVGSVARYFFGLSYQLLLNADQKSYIPNIINMMTMIFNTIVCAIIIQFGVQVHLLRIIYSGIMLLRPILINLYAHRNYKLDSRVEYDEEPIKQKWNGVAQHAAYFVLNNTDIMILTTFSNLKNVSIYYVYYMVVVGIRRVVEALSSGVTALFGNMLANKEYELLNRRFLEYEWLAHTIVILLFSCTAILITPFVSVYTEGITDANYIQPVFGILMSAAIGSYCIRTPYNVMVISAGHYRQTQVSSIIEMMINILVSVILVSSFGLIGVAIGTLSAMTYRSIYLAHYINGNIISYRFANFIRHLGVDLLMVLAIAILTSGFELAAVSYISWIFMAVKVFVVAVFVVFTVNMIFYRNHMLNIFHMVKR